MGSAFCLDGDERHYDLYHRKRRQLPTPRRPFRGRKHPLLTESLWRSDSGRSRNIILLLARLLSLPETNLFATVTYAAFLRPKIEANPEAASSCRCLTLSCPRIACQPM